LGEADHATDTAWAATQDAEERYSVKAIEKQKQYCQVRQPVVPNVDGRLTVYVLKAVYIVLLRQDGFDDISCLCRG
jgi:hypothetical protein